METLDIGKYIVCDFLRAVCVFMFIHLFGCPQLDQCIHKLLLWANILSASLIHASDC